MSFPLLPVAMVATAGAGLINYFSQMAQGDLERQMGDYEASQLEANARAVRRRARGEEKRFREEAAAFRGRQRAVRGASGVTVEGSPMDVLTDTVRLQELDALTIRLQGEFDAFNLTSQAALTRMGGRARRTGRRIGAFSSLLRAGSSLYGGMRIPSFDEFKKSEGFLNPMLDDDALKTRYREKYGKPRLSLSWE